MNLLEKAKARRIRVRAKIEQRQEGMQIVSDTPKEDRVLARGLKLGKVSVRPRVNKRGAG